MACFHVYDCASCYEPHCDDCLIECDGSCGERYCEGCITNGLCSDCEADEDDACAAEEMEEEEPE